MSGQRVFSGSTPSFHDLHTWRTMVETLQYGPLPHHRVLSDAFLVAGLGHGFEEGQIRGVAGAPVAWQD